MTRPNRRIYERGASGLPFEKEVRLWYGALDDYIEDSKLRKEFGYNEHKDVLTRQTPAAQREQGERHGGSYSLRFLGVLSEQRNAKGT